MSFSRLSRAFRSILSRICPQKIELSRNRNAYPSMKPAGVVRIADNLSRIGDSLWAQISKIPSVCRPGMFTYCSDEERVSSRPSFSVSNVLGGSNGHFGSAQAYPGILFCKRI
jgi:hypothetical protein